MGPEMSEQNFILIHPRAVGISLKTTDDSHMVKLDEIMLPKLLYFILWGPWMISVPNFRILLDF